MTESKDKSPIASPENSLVLSPETKIYRYLPLEKFMSMVEHQEFYLTKLSEWTDPYEDKALLRNARIVNNQLAALRKIWPYFLRIFKGLDIKDILPYLRDRDEKELLNYFSSAKDFFVNGVEDIDDYILQEEKHEKKFVNNEEFKKVFEVVINDPLFNKKHGGLLTKLSRYEIHYLIFAELTFASSWTIHDGASGHESDGLWVAYSKGSGVRIRTTVGKLENLLASVMDREEEKSYTTIITSAKILYSDREHIEEILVNDERIYHTHQPFLQKRKAFEYEQEIRVLITLHINGEHLLSTAQAVYADIPDISDFIEEVLIDPKAHPMHAETIKKYCEKNKLNCDDSKLYTFDIDYNPYDIDDATVWKFKKLADRLEKKTQ